MPVPDASALPAELTSLPHWIAWRTEVREGSSKPTKVPYCLATGYKASSTKPADWTDYPIPDTVPDAYNGVGFVFTKAAGFTGVDLDDCLNADGTLKAWAVEILDALPSYSEISPSGNGIKIWTKAQLPGAGLKVWVDAEGNRTVESMADGAIEMYDSGRYFAVTGNNYAGTLAIPDLQPQITALYKRFRGNERPELPISAPSSVNGKFDIPAGPAIAEGGRHAFLITQAAKWRARGMDIPELTNKLRELNAQRCSPPKPDHMLVGIAKWFEDKPPSYKPTRADYASAAQWATEPKAVAAAAGAGVSRQPVSNAVKDVEPEPEPAGPETQIAVIPEQSVADRLTEAVESAIDQGVEACYRPSLAREFAIAYLSGAESLIKANALKAKLKDKFKADLNLTRFSDGVRAIRDEIRSARHQPTGLKEGEIDLLRYGLNDQGNAERIRAVFGDDMRFCPDFKKWLIWDERRWIIDGNGKARQMAKEAMRKFLDQAGSYDEEFAKFASKSLNEKPLTAMLKMLESDLPISSSDLDRGPWALNCLNGTVDLRSAELMPHLREDYITKLVHFNYDPAADCPLWLKFLFSAMGDSEEASPAKVERAACMVSYIQRALGYSITGVTSEKAVFIPLGEFGNNGKSTMLDTVRRIIKEYSALLSVDTLMVRQESNNTQADLADLRGARFVQTSETEESQSLSQGKLKMLTAGMGTIKACRKFENPIEFEANFHIWLDTNKMPHIKDPDDTATLARMHPIPFLVQITKIDQEMPNKLYSEAEGILAWMVAGAQAWFTNRLQRPEEVTEAREQWKSAQEDPWAQTVETWIEKQNDEYFSSSKQFYYTASIPSILEGALGFKVKDMGQHRGEAIRLGRILKRAGWIVDKQAGASRIRVYRKAPTEELAIAS